MDIEERRRRAEEGSRTAQATLGLCYLHGTEVQRDYAEAFKYLTAVADQGASRAIANLADMYAQGLGVLKDTARAIELYERVGNVEFFAAIALGRIYSTGVDVPADTHAARKWYAVATSFELIVFECAELKEARAYILSSP